MFVSSFSQGSSWKHMAHGDRTYSNLGSKQGHYASTEEILIRSNSDCPSTSINDHKEKCQSQDHTLSGPCQPHPHGTASEVQTKNLLWIQTVPWTFTILSSTEANSVSLTWSCISTNLALLNFNEFEWRNVYSRHFQQTFTDYLPCAKHALCAQYSMVSKEACYLSSWTLD